ncbi:MAG TPA: hypothetical protein VGO11_13170 [Chthoniobacteraceae bacterium]|jgi:hypothetical protein|nr:hypothetical protein [Chthoniobacteraceae bacterium]
MKTLSLLFCSLVLPCLAHAQLLASPDATSRLLGKPTFTRAMPASNMTVANYKTDAYKVAAGFKENAAVYFVYKKQTGAAFAEAEIQQILDGHPGNEGKWKWRKDVITGRGGPAVHKGGVKDVNAAEEWHVFAKKEYGAAYYPEKKALVIWDAGSGVDPAALVNQSNL